MSTRRIRNPKFVPIGRKEAPGEMREILYKATLFIFIFPRTRSRLLKSPVDGF